MENKREFPGLGYITLLGSKGSDEYIAQRARNTIEGASLRSKDAALLDHLIRNRHTSPIEFGQVDFEVECPKYIAVQWMRHRTGAYQETSLRYSVEEKGFAVPEKFRTQGDGPNRQMSGAEFDEFQGDHVKLMYELSCAESYDNYKALLELDVSREQARGVLPVSHLTRFSVSMSLHNWLHFLKLRLAEGAQPEIRCYAEFIFEALKGLFPLIMGSWENHVLNAVTFSRDEMDLLFSGIDLLGICDNIDSSGLRATRLKELYSKVYKVIKK